MAWKRSSAASRGYGPAWEALRREVLAEEPLCRGCGSLSTEVDHVVAKAFGGTDARGNLEGLCAGCHRQKTVKERHGVVLSFGASPRLFVDVDGTLVRFGGAVNWRVVAFVKAWVRGNPGGRLVVWSKRGAAYAQVQAARSLPGWAWEARAKANVRPEAGWLFIDDEPLPAWAAVCVAPWRVPQRDSVRREPEGHPGAVDSEPPGVPKISGAVGPEATAGLPDSNRVRVSGVDG